MQGKWPTYFGTHTPWKGCNKHGTAGKNARKRIWTYIRDLLKHGFKPNGRRRSSVASNDVEREQLKKKRKLANDRSRRRYNKNKAKESIPEGLHMEVALDILEEFIPGARLWMTKVKPNLEEVRIFVKFS